VDAHALALLLQGPRQVSRFGHDAVVGKDGAGHHGHRRPAVDAHPQAQPGVRLVRDLEHDRPGQDVQRHQGDLGHVAVACAGVVGGHGQGRQTNSEGQPGDQHEVIIDGVEIVDLGAGTGTGQAATL
jgi:hypothetical protein